MAAAAAEIVYKPIRLDAEKDFKIHIPTHLIIAGATNSGKTTLAYHLILGRDRVFSGQFASITYMYQYPQAIYDRLKDVVVMVQGFRPDLLDQLPRPACVILDDLDSEVFSSAKILQYAKGASHHSNLTLIIITQSLYHHAREAKFASEIIKQAKGFFLCQLVREKYALRILASQLNIGSSSKYLLSAYEQSVERPPVLSSMQLPCPPHIFLNFGTNVRAELRCVGNYIRNAEVSSSKELAAVDIRAKVWWLFVEMLKGGSKADSSPAAKLYYLLTEAQLRALTATSTTEEDAHEQRQTANGGDNNNNWKTFLEMTVPMAVKKFPKDVQSKAMAMAKYFREPGGGNVTDDGELEFTDDNGELVTVSDALGAVIYFVIPPLDGGRLVQQPRALYSLARWLKNAPVNLFAKRREPRRILHNMRKYYQQP